MVTTDTSQLTAECETWRQQLRNSRQDITQLQDKLRQIALKISQNELLRDVEHYQNQFHIQLINIHDLKHLIKAHEHKAALEKSGNNGLHDATWAEHERLFDEYQRLDATLQSLRDAFNAFLARLN